MGPARGRRRKRSKRRKVGTAPPPIRPPLDREQAKRLYQQGLTVADVARRTGYAYKTVRKALRDQGLGPRPPVTRTGKWARVLYLRWQRMRSKCRQRSFVSYPAFGGRGIGICAQWESFPAFHAWALESGFRPGLHLALIRRDRDFSPKNCTWLTRSETTRRSAREHSPKIRAFGETKTLIEWSEDRRCRVSARLLRHRLRARHEPETAISTPIEALHGRRVKKRSRPVLEVREPGRRIDWKKAEREWRAHPTNLAAFARELGVSRTAVEAHLGHLAGLAPKRPRLLPADQEASLRLRWRQLFRKTGDPSDRLYRWVGGKGLRVCRAWRRFERFLEWAAGAGYRPGLRLARIDRSKGYSPSNCRWMTASEAGRRPKRDVKPPPPRWPVEAYGEVKSISAWSRDRRCQVSQATLQRRMRAGWEPESALNTAPNNPGPPPRMTVSAFGERKTLVAWSEDRRCRISLNGLRQRLLRTIPAEEAIATPPFQLVVGPRRRR